MTNSRYINELPWPTVRTPGACPAVRPLDANGAS